MVDSDRRPSSGHVRAVLPLVGLLCLAIWAVASYVLWRQGSLTVARLLGLGLAGSACWFAAGSVLHAQRSSGIKRTCLVIGALALAIWAIPAALFSVGERLAVRMHLLIWAILYLGGLVCVLTRWFGHKRSQ